MTGSQIESALQPYISGNTLSIGPNNQLGSPRLNSLLSNFFSGTLTATVSAPQVGDTTVVYSNASLATPGFLLYQKVAQVTATLTFSSGLDNQIDCSVEASMPTGYQLSDSFGVISDTQNNSFSQLALSDSTYTVSSAVTGLVAQFSSTILSQQGLTTNVAWLLGDSLAISGSVSISEINSVYYPALSVTSTALSSPDVSGFELEIFLTVQSGLSTIPSSDGSPTLLMAVTLTTELVTPNLTLPVMILLQQTNQKQYTLVLDPTKPAPAVGSLASVSGFTGGTAPSLSVDTPIGALSLNSVSITFDTDSRQFSNLQIAISLGTHWWIVNNILELQKLTAVIVVPNLYVGSGATITFSITVTASLVVGSAVLDAFVQYPEEIVGIELDPTSVIDVNDFISTFASGASLPGSGDLTIYDFSAIADIGQNTYSLECQAVGNLSIIPTFQLDQLSLSVQYSTGSPLQFAFGAIFTLTTANAELYLSAGTSGSGWLLSGGTYQQQNINLTDLVVDLLNIFGISLPTNLPEFVLQDLELQNYDTSNGSFTFIASIAYVNETDPILQKITGSTNISYSGTPDKQWTGNVTGSMLVGSNSFTVSYDFKVAQIVNLSWQATGSETVDIAALCQLLGISPPDIPSDIDLTLKEVDALYDITNKVFIAIADTVKYGSLAFVYQQGTPTSLLGFAIETTVTFSLSNLPLVGAELAKIENIQVSDFQISVSNQPLATAAVTLNNLLKQYSSYYPVGLTYPTFPTLPTGATTDVVFTATFDYGAGTLPITVPLDGGSISTPAPEGSRALATTTGAAGGGQVSSSTTPDGTTWFTIQKSFGPVTIQKIGLLYQSSSQTLWFEVSGTLAFGPLALSLMGLGIGSPLSSFSPEFSLQGLGVSYSNPPLQVVGELVNLQPPGSKTVAFEGALVIGTGEFTVQAIGYYGDTTGFPSFFIFIDVAYDFGGPPAFFVTGIAGGFGYNSQITLPTINQVQTFPFIEILPSSAVYNPNVFGPSSPSTLQVLNSIVSGNPPWVTPTAGSIWIIAGLTFTSFELVNSEALLVVQVGSQFTIALLGVARAQFPQVGSELYAVIEMEIEIVFAPQQGVFSLQAVLSPSSFVIAPACVLTGGFAFFVWFGSNANAGDFVVTLGGYNPGFTPPNYYPAVPQVGFHWSLDSSITIKGGAYFALTPSVLMLGGELDVTYQSGNLQAWLNAHADVIIRWKPFWFDANIGVTIGASYKIDLLFTTKKVTVELGCDLELWGPPTGGTVTVHWYIISFTIDFGAAKNSNNQPQSWSDVQGMLANTGTDAAYNVLTLKPATGLLSTPQSSNGGAGQTGDNGGGSTPWVVRASSFSFSTGTPIPSTTVSVGSWSAQGDSFNVHPLNWTGVTATHEVTITDEGGNDVSAAFTPTPVYNSVPSSLWGSPPESNGQPQVPPGNNQLVTGQIVGLSVSVNAPSTGNTAGPMDVQENLETDNLGLSGAVLPLSASAPPAGDVPVNSQNTIATIADPNNGIASVTATAARLAIFNGLTSLQYGPDDNDAMNNFANEIGCSLAGEPLLVS